jgi:hypothetical protein
MVSSLPEPISIDWDASKVRRRNHHEDREEYEEENTKHTMRADYFFS